jgi:hypothetical protein
MNKEINQGTAQPETESAQLLWSIHAFPSSIAELTDMPVELVGRAIAYAQSEPGIASIPGWVVEALRRHRDQGWPIPAPRTRPIGLTTCDHPIAVETYTSGAYGDLFRLGSDTTDLDDSQLDSAEVALVPPDASAPAQPPEETGVQPDQLVDGQEAVDEESQLNEEVTRQLRAELGAVCRRQRGRVIAGLRIQVAGDTTRLICATFVDMAIVQNELIGALQRILVQLGAPSQLVFTTRAGWEARRDRAGNARSRPAATSGLLSTA